MDNETVPEMSDPYHDLGPVGDLRNTCTFETCGVQYSYFPYRPSKTANLAFTILFSISTIAYILQGIARRKWPGFTIAMVCGNTSEVAGYIGRVLAYNNLYHEEPFLVQIVCLTIGPAFLAAGIYLCLARIVVTFGVENSRIKARSFPHIFIPCDMFSLVLQAAGGGYASVKTHRGEDAKVGNNIMLAGLVVQVVTLFTFIVLALDFAVRTTLRIKRVGAASALDSRHVALRKSWVFQGFLVALALSTLCIFTRCVYRVAELSEGWGGRLIKKQGLFIGLEGVVVVVAVYLFNFFHPGFCFKDALDTPASNARSGGRKWYGGKRTIVVHESSLETIHTDK